MAFPTSGLTNNQVHKEGNRAFVYDSTLGVWDQVREVDRTENKILSGTIRGGSIGSGVTGLTGIKEADTWRPTTVFTGDASPITAGWERDDTDKQGTLGSGMNHNGIGEFDFPSTGHWLIFFQSQYAFPSSMESRTLFAGIDVWIDGVGWNSAAYALSQGQMYESVQSYECTKCQCIIRVTAIQSNYGVNKDKIRFRHEVNNNSVASHFDTSANEAYAMFIRLGDV